MLEKEMYGKLKKMCNTLDDIKKLLIIQAEVKIYSEHHKLDDAVFFTRIEQIDKIKKGD